MNPDVGPIIRLSNRKPFLRVNYYRAVAPVRRMFGGRSHQSSVYCLTLYSGGLFSQCGWPLGSNQSHKHFIS